MHKKTLPIFIFSLLLVIPAVFALPNLGQIASDIFGSGGFLVSLFGGVVVGNGQILLAYLRIGLFLTLFTVFFEVLVNLNQFANRRNSAIAISLFISALGSFFVSQQLYELLITTYSTIIWFFIIGVPVAAILLAVLLTPTPTRAYAAFKILMLLFLFYLLNIMIDYTSTSLFPLLFLIPTKKKFNYKKLLIPLGVLVLVPSVFAQGPSAAIATFATWAELVVGILIVYYTLFKLIPGGDNERKEKPKKEPDTRSLPEKIEAAREWTKDLGKSIGSLGKEAEKEEEILKEAIKTDADDVERIEGLDKITAGLKNSKLSDEGKEVLLAKIEGTLSDFKPPSANIGGKLAPINPLYEAMRKNFQEVQKNAKSIEKKVNKLKRKKRSALEPNLLALQTHIGSAQHHIAHIESIAGDRGVLKQLDSKFASIVSSYKKALREEKFKLANHHLSELKAIKESAEKYIESILSLEDAIRDTALNLRDTLGMVIEALPRK